MSSAADISLPEGAELILDTTFLREMTFKEVFGEDKFAEILKIEEETLKAFLENC